jgi:hypothetical protein
MEEFLKHFESVNSKFEFTKIKDWNIKVISKEEALENKTDNIYFCAWIDTHTSYLNGERAKDDDIVEKNYLCIDLDIKKNFHLEYWEECSYDDIEKEAENIINFLDEDYLKEFSFIVISGWWLHIYYTWEFQKFDKLEHKMWVKEIFEKWDNYFWNKTFSSDPACSNISRILRLPWSINQKYWKECKIIYNEKKDSKLFNNLKFFAKQRLEREETERLKKEAEVLSKFSKTDNGFYEQINKIPAYTIAQKLIPQYIFDWKKNFKNGKGWFTAYFYNPNTNTIINGWSRHFNYWDDSSWFNNFSLVKHFFNLTNAETFNFFKNL